MKRVVACFVLIILAAAAVFVGACRVILAGRNQASPAAPPPVAAVETPELPEETPVLPSVESSPAPSVVPSAEPTPARYEGEAIAEYALQFNGYDYNYGGTAPETGFDCSGLVYYVYKQFGYRLSRVAETQARDGMAVGTLEELLPGDLICFSWHGRRYINHVGLYIGNGEFIHAMDSAHDVLITSLEEYLQNHDWVARRIVGAVEKKTPQQIEAEEQYDRILAERAAAAATPTPSAAPITPPPSTIPDAAAIDRAEEERRHQEEIAQAWREIRGEESPSPVPTAPPTEETPPEVEEEIPLPEAPAAGPSAPGLIQIH